MAPPDVLAVLGANDLELANALIREPLGALGLALPELPSPAAVGSQMLGNLPPLALPGMAPKTNARKEEGAPKAARTRIIGSGYRGL